MTDTLTQAIWDALTERVGEDLRAVLRYDATGYTSRMRDDVDEQYDPEEGRTIVDQTIITQLSQQELSDHIKTGSLNGLVRVFDESWILTWPDDKEGKSGVYISIERHGDTATMADAEWIIQYLEAEIAPRLS